MTKEEAIEEINKVFEPAFANYIITALTEGVTVSDKALEQQPCDAVNRQAVLDTLDKMDKALDTDRTVENYKELLNECYKVLPSVTPKGKTGHWEYVQYDGNPNIGNLHCSECERIAGFEYNFCPNCGARMVSE